MNYIKVYDDCKELKKSIGISTNKLEIDHHPVTEDVYGLFGIYNPTQSELISNNLCLYLCQKNATTTEDGILLDKVVISFCPIGKYFEFWSMRETKPTGECEYPLDNGKVTASVYNEAHAEAGFASPNQRDLSKDALVFIHGFNWTKEDAIIGNCNFFRRLYWSGYRGNYFGITWYGDYFPFSWEVIKSNDPRRLLHKSYFDTDVFQALQSSDSLRLFIENKISNLPAIHLVAHSLGNLVMWDAIRLHTYTPHAGDIKRINNVVSIEGAVWSEAFRDPAPLCYRNESNQENNIIYDYNGTVRCPICQDCPNCTSCTGCTHNPDASNCPHCQNCPICQNRTPIAIGADLEKHSWSHWFRQEGHSAFSVVDRFVNSTTTKDYALEGMKYANLLCLGEHSHYNRTYGFYRSLDRNSLPEFSSLLKRGHRRSIGILFDDLTSPMGLTNFKNNPDLDFHLASSELQGSPDYLIDYPTTGNVWLQKEHTDMLDAPFYRISPWYVDVFYTHTHILTPNN